MQTINRNKNEPTSEIDAILHESLSLCRNMYVCISSLIQISTKAPASSEEEVQEEAGEDEDDSTSSALGIESSYCRYISS